MKTKLSMLLAVCVFLTSCTVSRESDDPGTPTESAGAFSTLDAAGVKQIRASRTARLDMSSGTLQKDAVRFTGSYPPEINTRGSGKIKLTIVGPAGEVSGETDRIRFNTTDRRSDFSEITYFLTADSTAEYFAIIRDGSERYGIDRAAAERWITAIENDPGTKSAHALPEGTDPGIAVGYDLRYDGSKHTQVIIVHIHPAG